MNKTILPESAVSALSSGRKVEAIKIVRQVNKLDLKEAHDLVTQYIHENPAISETLNTRRDGHMLRLIAILIIIGIVIYILTIA